MFSRVLKSLLPQRQEPNLEQELERLEREAAVPALDFRAAVYGRAGDLCVKAGEHARALGYYGRAIDGYLGVGYYDTAIAMCEKVIRIAPGVVRTRCTLAFLMLGEDLPYLPARGVSQEARDQLQEYVHAARGAGREAVAVQRLRMMADVTEVEAVRQLIADLLFDLDASDEAADLHYSLFEERANLAAYDPERSRTQRQRWADMLRIAIMDE